MIFSQRAKIKMAAGETGPIEMPPPTDEVFRAIFMNTIDKDIDFSEWGIDASARYENPESGNKPFTGKIPDSINAIKGAIFEETHVEKPSDTDPSMKVYVPKARTPDIHDDLLRGYRNFLTAAREIEFMRRINTSSVSYMTENVNQTLMLVCHSIKTSNVDPANHRRQAHYVVADKQMQKYTMNYQEDPSKDSNVNTLNGIIDEYVQFAIDYNLLSLRCLFSRRDKPNLIDDDLVLLNRLFTRGRTIEHAAVGVSANANVSLDVRDRSALRMFVDYRGIRFYALIRLFYTTMSIKKNETDIYYMSESDMDVVNDMLATKCDMLTNVHIAIRSERGYTAEHLLNVSTYNPTQMRMDSFLLNHEQLTCDDDVRLIPTNVRTTQGKENKKRWRFHVPVPEQDLYVHFIAALQKIAEERTFSDQVIDEITQDQNWKKFERDLREASPRVRSVVQEAIRAPQHERLEQWRKGYTIPALVNMDEKEFKGSRMIDIGFYSSNNLVAFTASFDVNTKIVFEKTTFVCIIKYPVLYTSIERAMAQVRYEAFALYRERKEARQQENPRPHPAPAKQDGQAQDGQKKSNNPAAFTTGMHFRRDDGRLVFPYRLLRTCPRKISYEELKKRNKIREKPDFLLNFMEKDSKVVYRVQVGTNGDLWNKLQLARINGEVKVSRAMAACGRVSFYEYKHRKMWERMNYSGDVYPFKLYIALEYQTNISTWKEHWLKFFNDNPDAVYVRYKYNKILPGKAPVDAEPQKVPKPEDFPRLNPEPPAPPPRVWPMRPVEPAASVRPDRRDEPDEGDEPDERDEPDKRDEPDERDEPDKREESFEPAAPVRPDDQQKPVEPIDPSKFDPYAPPFRPRQIPPVPVPQVPPPESRPEWVPKFNPEPEIEPWPEAPEPVIEPRPVLPVPEPEFVEPRPESPATEPVVEPRPESPATEPVVEPRPESPATEPVVEPRPESPATEPVVEPRPESPATEPVVEPRPVINPTTPEKYEPAQSVTSPRSRDPDQWDQ
jgi:hypothetical protein